MRLTFTIILTIVFFQLLNAQTIEVTPATKNVPVDIKVFDTPHYLEIKNNGTKPIRIDWKKTVFYKTEEWGISICDTINCYIPNGPDTAQLYCLINPGTVLEYKIIAYPHETEGEALVGLKIWEYGNEANSTTVEVHFNGLISTDNPELSSLKVFPNPVKDALSLENNQSFELGDIFVYNAIGALVKQIKSDGFSNRYDISELNDGLYFMKIYSRDNLSSAIKRFVKNGN